MTEVRVVNEQTGGAKGSKPQRFDLLPWDALATIAEVYTFGASKYEDHNWRRGYSWGLSYAALQRHLAAFWEGQDTDPESGLPHLAHAGFHVLALLTFAADGRYAELDDRWTSVRRRLEEADDAADARKAIGEHVEPPLPCPLYRGDDDEPSGCQAEYREREGGYGPCLAECRALVGEQA